MMSAKGTPSRIRGPVDASSSAARHRRRVILLVTAVALFGSLLWLLLQDDRGEGPTVSPDAAEEANHLQAPEPGTDHALTRSLAAPCEEEAVPDGTPTLRGRVVSESGEGLAEAQVRVLDCNHRELCSITTGPDGRFSWPYRTTSWRIYLDITHYAHWRDWIGYVRKSLPHEEQVYRLRRRFDEGLETQSVAGLVW